MWFFFFSAFISYLISFSAKEMVQFLSLSGYGACESPYLMERSRSFIFIQILDFFSAQDLVSKYDAFEKCTSNPAKFLVFSYENGHSKRNQWQFWRYKTKSKLFELRFPTPRMNVPRMNIERVRMSIVRASELIRFILVVSNCTRNTFKEVTFF